MGKTYASAPFQEERRSCSSSCCRHSALARCLFACKQALLFLKSVTNVEVYARTSPKEEPQLLFKATSSPTHLSFSTSSGNPAGARKAPELFVRPQGSFGGGAFSEDQNQGTLQKPILQFLALQTTAGGPGGSDVQRLMKKLAQ
ncbi:hypothetical protein DUNSADRAFT_7200, partial [Dunaliella salina]